MKSADYWRERAGLTEEAAHRKAARVISAVEEWYLEAQRSVRRELESWYGRFASGNGVSMTEARRLLNSRQLEEFRLDVSEYIRIAQELGLDPEWQRKLENASAKFHVSRLESLEVTIQQQIELLCENQLDAMDELYRDIVGSGYTRTAFDVQSFVGIGWDITAPDEARLERLLSQPWSTDGRTFRDRCWVQKEELRTAVQKSMIQGLLRGDPPLKTSEAIKKQFGVSQYKAARLINTETTYFNALSARESYRDLHVDRVEIIETPDGSTCELCGGLDGTVILISQFEPGVTVPPFHPNCRGTTAPAIDPKYADGERFARGEDGKGYYIPADMTYEEWKAAFADGGDKSGLKSAADGGIIQETVDAVQRYMESGTAYSLNSALRNGMALTDEQSELVRSLDKALDSLPDYKGVVYRSLSSTYIENIDDFWRQHSVGNFVSYPAYTSTSKSIYDPTMDIQLRIVSKHGKDISAINTLEQEVLFKRNTRFCVRSVKDGVIELEEI